MDPDPCARGLAILQPSTAGSMLRFAPTSGPSPPTEILLFGSSQGADRAVALARKFPRKYTRLVLLSGPTEVAPKGLEQLQGAALFVGEMESDWAMKRTAKRWQEAGIRAHFHVIKNAGHADFYGRGNPLMRDAFDFLF